MQRMLVADMIWRIIHEFDGVLVYPNTEPSTDFVQMMKEKLNPVCPGFKEDPYFPEYCEVCDKHETDHARCA